MKAIEINGEIKIYNELPQSWGGVMGNFSKLSDEEIEAYGFYDVVTPDYDPSLQELTDLYFENNKYHYTIIQKTWSETLEELKTHKLNFLNETTKAKLENTDWYYIRKLHRDIEVPQSINDERALILNNHNSHEAAISELTKKEDVIKYELK